VLSAPFASEKLSTNGKVVHAVISPDGKNVVYTNGTGSDKESIWLRQLESNSNIEIIPPSDDLYAGITLSPDGNTLYFVRRSRLVEETAAIYRVSIFGGVPQKIIGETQGSMSISPDGTKISFVRCYYRKDEYCSLWIADADGKNERKLASRPSPIRIRGNKISPDGKSVAFAVGQSENAANEFSLLETDIETGTERELTKLKFFNINSLSWLPDKSGLLLTARINTDNNFRIWLVSKADGNSSPLTKDSESYSALSLDKEANRLVSTQVKPEFNLRLFSLENPQNKRIVTNARRVSFASNGKILISSPMSGNDEIWSLNADGSEQRQLTNEVAEDNSAVTAPDNNSIFFASNRSGAIHVWRMNSDGSNQTQITQKEGGFPLFVSPDGHWVYYHHGLDRTLWRVSTQNGEEQSVINKGKYAFAISPDGTKAAFPERQNDERLLTVVSLADGQTIKTFKLNAPKAHPLFIVWTSDGKNLAYITSDSVFQNKILWLQPLSDETPQQITAFGDEEITSLAAAPDGKTFAVTQGSWKHDAVLLKGLR
jgi:Tol biopolymer transport system component